MATALSAATPWGCDVCNKVYPVFEEAQMCERLCRAGRPGRTEADVVRALMNSRLSAASAAFSEEMASEQRKAATRFAAELERKLAEREREVIARERAQHEDTHRTVRREHASTVGDLSAAHDAELQLVREKVTADCKRQLIEARDRNAKEIEQVTLALERLQSAYDGARKQDGEEHSLEMEKALIALRESHAAEMVEMEARFAARQEDHQKSVRKAVVEMQAEHRRKLDEVQSRETDARLHAAEQRHAAALGEQESALNLEFQRLRNEEAEKLTQSVAELKSAYEERLRQAVSDQAQADELRMREAVAQQAAADEVVFNERIADFEAIVASYRARSDAAPQTGGGYDAHSMGRVRAEMGGGMGAPASPSSMLAGPRSSPSVRIHVHSPHSAQTTAGGGHRGGVAARRNQTPPPALSRSILLGGGGANASASFAPGQTWQQPMQQPMQQQQLHQMQEHQMASGSGGGRGGDGGGAARQQSSFQSQLEAAMAPLRAFGGNDYMGSGGGGGSPAGNSNLLSHFANPFSGTKTSPFARAS